MSFEASRNVETLGPNDDQMIHGVTLQYGTVPGAFKIEVPASCAASYATHYNVSMAIFDANGQELLGWAWSHGYGSNVARCSNTINVNGVMVGNFTMDPSTVILWR